MPPGQWPAPGPQQGPSPWGPTPPPPPSGNAVKWVLGGLALLVVIVLTVVATLLFTKDGSDPDTPPTASAPPSTSADTSDIASAGDRGPAGIITEDRTCAAWAPINDKLAAEQRKGWDRRNPSIPEDQWTPEQRSHYESVASAMRQAADQTVALAKKTPHRVMRELYEQSIAYSREYAERVASYSPSDNYFAQVANSVGATLVWICAAISYGSAPAREPLVVAGAPPITLAALGDPSTPRLFMPEPSPMCPSWRTMVDQFTTSTDEWATSTDPNIPAANWSSDQLAHFTSVVPAMQQNADEVDQLGIRSDNPIMDDLATLAAQYRRAYIQAIPTYSPADNYLDSTASQILAVVNQACDAAEI